MSEENKEKKNKKIAKMSASELESALKKSNDNHLTVNCLYVQHLNISKKG
jgi:hypothetical protein